MGDMLGTSLCPRQPPLQEMFIYDSAGKEIFADHVPQFVRSITCACLLLVTMLSPPPHAPSGSIPRWW